MYKLIQGKREKEKVAKKCTDSTKFSYWKNSYQILIAQLKEEDANRHAYNTFRTINAMVHRGVYT